MAAMGGMVGMGGIAAMGGIVGIVRMGAGQVNIYGQWDALLRRNISQSITHVLAMVSSGENTGQIIKYLV